MAYSLVIFDKDGTLIDFLSMWGGWGRQVARCLERQTGVNLQPVLAESWGFDLDTGVVDPSSKLAMAPMSELVDVTIRLLADQGVPATQVQQALQHCWVPPDPVALARPLADLPLLFGQLRSRAYRIAVATADDRQPTEATLAALGVASLIDTSVCADDGIAHKPAPDAIYTICQRLDVAPAQSVMVGDTLYDMRMGRAAGCGLVVGVAATPETHSLLAPYADVVIANIAALLDLL